MKNIWTLRPKEKKPTPCCKNYTHIPLMMVQLKLLVDAGKIKEEWSCEFICKMYVRFKQGYPLTDKQRNKIAEMFNKLNKGDLKWD